MADEQQVCPNCGNFNRAGARFCSKCGHVFKPSAVATAPVTPAPAAPPPSPATPVSTAGALLCPNCGKEVSADTRFCRHCGHPLGATQPAAAPAVNVAAAVPVSRATPAPAVSVAKSDDDMTQPLGVKSAPPTPATPAKVASSLSTGAERGAPAWLWALVGLLIGILLGAGIVLAAPGFVGLARIAAPEATPAAPATDAMTPGSPAVPETTTPLELPTDTTDVVATATPEPSPAAAATATPTAETVPATVAPPDEAAASPTTATESTTAVSPDETEAPPADAPTTTAESATAPADDAAAETSPTSTPLAP